MFVTAQNFAIAKDKLHFYERTCYGTITNIWVLYYEIFIKIIFLCDCIEDTRNIGWKKSELGVLTLYDVSRIGHRDDPFIMFSNAKQMIYV